MLQTRLKAYGYTHTKVLEGATYFNDVRVKTAGKLRPEDIARVKGLGFLMDKRTGDTFNGRVITRNGKITTAESRAIAEAAELYGSGEIAMTSRLTVEIQGVPYDNIEKSPARTFAPGRVGNRRNRGKGAPGRQLQGNDLPVRADRHLRALRRNSQALL